MSITAGVGDVGGGARGVQRGSALGSEFSWRGTVSREISPISVAALYFIPWAHQVLLSLINLPPLSSPTPLLHTFVLWPHRGVFLVPFLARWSISPNSGLTSSSTILDKMAPHFNILSTAPQNLFPLLHLYPNLKPVLLYLIFLPSTEQRITPSWSPPPAPSAGAHQCSPVLSPTSSPPSPFHASCSVCSHKFPVPTVHSLNSSRKTKLAAPSSFVFPTQPSPFEGHIIFSCFSLSSSLAFNNSLL